MIKKIFLPVLITIGLLLFSTVDNLIGNKNSNSEQVPQETCNYHMQVYGKAFGSNLYIRSFDLATTNSNSVGLSPTMNYLDLQQSDRDNPKNSNSHRYYSFVNNNVPNHDSSIIYSPNTKANIDGYFNQQFYSPFDYTKEIMTVGTGTLDYNFEIAVFSASVVNVDTQKTAKATGVIQKNGPEKGFRLNEGNSAATAKNNITIDKTQTQTQTINQCFVYTFKNTQNAIVYYGFSVNKIFYAVYEKNIASEAHIWSTFII